MAKADAWMPLWIGDYRRDTSRLTLAEHGAYLLLLMDSWTNGPPADDDAELCRILGCQPAEWRKTRQKIARFFTISGGVWHHKRVASEKAGAEERSGKAAAKARLAAEARWGREKGGKEPAEPMPQAMLQALPGAMPEDVLEQCPPPVTCSVPTEQASETPDKRAWREAVTLLTLSGRMKESAARSFFGKLLRDHKLEPYSLLPTMTAADPKGTPDPQAYLTAAAKKLGTGNGLGDKTAANVAEWSPDVWRAALEGFKRSGRWDPATMGPTPDQLGCWAPARVLAEWRNAA